jgi:hypothetical protein
MNHARKHRGKKWDDKPVFPPECDVEILAKIKIKFGFHGLSLINKKLENRK